MRQTGRLTQDRIFYQQLVRRIPYQDNLAFYKKIGYDPHDGQKEIHKSRAIYRIPTCGRRFGKSELCAPEALHVGALGGWTMIAAPTYKNTDVDFRACLKYIDNHSSGLISVVSDVVTTRGNQEILFKTGGRIFVRSTQNPSTLVGEGLDLLIFDEAAEEHDPFVWEENLRPALFDRDGSALFPSTPEGEDWYKDLHDKGDGSNIEMYESWQMPTMANPLINMQRLFMELGEMPEDIYKQEILATFIASAGAVFRNWERIATLDIQFDPTPGHFYVLGVDLGKYEDWTVITVMNALTGDAVYVRRFNQLDWLVQEAIIKEVAWHWQAPVLIDATAQGGDRILTALQNSINFVPVEGYVYTPASKVALVNQYRVAVEHQWVHILNKKQTDEDGKPIGRTVTSEHASFRYSRTESGRLKMEAPKGKHDDAINSHMLAYEMSMRYSGAGPRAGRAVPEDQKRKITVIGQSPVSQTSLGTPKRLRPKRRITRFG